MIYPIQPRSPFRAAQIGEAAKHSSFSELLRSGQTSVCSSIAAAVSHHHEGSHLIYGPLASILLDQGFPAEYELDEFNTSHTETTLSHLQYWLRRLRCKIPLQHLATSPLGNIFWRHSHFSPKQPELQTHSDYNHFCPQTANMTFATLWQTYFPRTFNNALT